MDSLRLFISNGVVTLKRIRIGDDEPESSLHRLLKFLESISTARFDVKNGNDCTEIRSPL